MTNKIERWLRFMSLNWLIISFSLLNIFISIIMMSVWPLLSMISIVSLFILLILFYFKLEKANDSASSELYDLEIEKVQKMSLLYSPIAVVVYQEGLVQWFNPTFNKMFKQLIQQSMPLLSIDQQFEYILTLPFKKSWYEVIIQGKHYKVLHQMTMNAIYFVDITKEKKLLSLREEEKIVFGYILLDDYDDLMHSLDDAANSQLDTAIVTALNEWTDLYGIYLKRIEDDKFLLLTTMQVLKKIESAKFKEFERIKLKSFQQNMPLAISIGITYAETLNYTIDQLAKRTQLNLDLALGRGGDQIVISSENGTARYYGGKMNPIEKRTSIRSKRVYQALLTSIEQVDTIFIAGHRYPDFDSIASAIGMYKIVQQQGKKVKIILDEEELTEEVQGLLEIPSIKKEHNFISLLEAIEEIAVQKEKRVLMILVDHHRPNLSAAGTLVSQHEVVVIDHHRRSEDFPPHSVLTFIEPYASSTSELVTEFFIHMGQVQESLTRDEATALLGGIIVDTHNFKARTGSRTFDAASYLKNRGANILHIQELLKEDFTKMQARNRIINEMSIYRQIYAIALAPKNQKFEHVIAAQVADQLLGIRHIEASFVIYQRLDGRIGISARSTGMVNVQLLMEQFGGGGHLSNAATQIEGATLEEIHQQLKILLEANEEEVV